MKLSRDLMVCTAATVSLVYEVTLGGGRPAVLTALVSLLLSPLIMRVDEARKGKNGKDHEPTDDGEGRVDVEPS